MTFWWRLAASVLSLVTTFTSAASEIDPVLEFYVDAPVVNVWQEQDIEVGGWIWAGIEDPIERVVLESEGWSFPLDFLLERNDVADYLGQQRAANSGFHGRLALPATTSSDTTFFCCLQSLWCENRAQAVALPTSDIINKVAALVGTLPRVA